MYRYIFISISLISSITFSSYAHDRIIIRLRPHITTRSQLIHMKDIADIHTKDHTIHKRIADIDIAEFTAKDTHLLITKKHVFYRLQVAQLLPSDFILIGSDDVKVYLQRRILRPEEIVQVAKDSLLQSLPYPADTVEVELAIPVHVALPEVAADDQIRISARPHIPPRLGRVQMDVTVYVNDRSIISLAMYFNVRFRSSSMIMQSSAVGGSASSSPVTHPSTGSGAAFESSRSSDAIIRPGQRVTLVVQSGALRVTAIGEALEHGRFGQVIRVQNVDSKKVLFGRVAGPGTVEVDLGVNR